MYSIPDGKVTKREGYNVILQQLLAYWAAENIWLVILPRINMYQWYQDTR
jgi:hypothetical protein